MNEIRELTEKKMLVWDNYEENAFEASVIGKYRNRYMVVESNMASFWNHAKPLPNPWEVPPAGYRLVTDEELEKYSGTITHHAYFSSQMWNKIKNPSDKIGTGFIAYAVPLDYSFEPQPVKVTIGGISGEISAESAKELQRMLKGVE